MDVRIIEKKNKKLCVDEKKRKCKHNGSNVCLKCSIYSGDGKKDNLFEFRK